MGHFKRSATVVAAMACLWLTACGTGRTMVMEPVAEKVAFDAAKLERSKDSVEVPEELRTMFVDKLRADLYGTAEAAGPFTEGEGLTIRIKVVQFQAGSQFQRWFWGGVGNQGEASMQLLTEFFQGDKKLAHIQTEGRIGSGFFGGSVKSAVEKAASEVSTYAVSNFADPTRAAAFLKK
jgi:Domain of unknown function (DUF4410)